MEFIIIDHKIERKSRKVVHIFLCSQVSAANKSWERIAD